MTEEHGGVTLHDGFAMRVVGPDRKELRLTAPDGRVCLKISLTPDGPLVEISAASLSVATDGDVTIDCERFGVNARRDVVVVAGGTIAHDAGADITTRAEGEIQTEAVAQRHRARLGNVDLIANDDVSLEGERIRLNSPDVRRSPHATLGRAVASGPGSEAPQSAAQLPVRP